MAAGVTILHKGKAGAFVGGDLAVRELGVDTTNDVIYGSSDGSTVWSVSGGGIANVVEDTTPQLGGQLDVNGNALGDGTLELLTFTETASAVNHVNITNAATAGDPAIGAAGDDANINLNLTAKGSGVVQAGGVEIVTVSGTQTLTNKTLTSATLTTPRIATTGFIADGGGDEYLVFVEGTTPVNHFQITSANTGVNPQFAAVGTDANISLNLVAKGTGVVQAGGVEVVTLSGTQTLTNKTMSAANNTIDGGTI